MKYYLLLCCYIWTAISASAERLCGLERMEQFSRIPEIVEGARAFQISSHDRRGGNDGDGYFGTHPCLYEDENGEKVLYDERQPGCLYRFWMTFTSASVLTNHLRFYFDDEPIPSIDLSVAEFFAGTNAPFLFPIVGNASDSCRGYYSYCPFPYAESLKVTISSVPTNTGTKASPFYYNITAHRYDSAECIETWNGSEDVLPVTAMLSETGTDPKPTNGNSVVSGTAAIGPDSTLELFSTIGGGTIQSIRIDPVLASWQQLQECSLRMNWDGGAEEVDVPLCAFFGSVTNELEMLSLPVGMNLADDWYCYFPMPFWTSAVIRISNDGAEPVEVPFELQVASNVYERARCGYFVAKHQSQYVLSDGQDVIFADEIGRGHFVGLSLFIRGDDFTGNNLDHLEGDERIYIDNSLSPALYGTGSEDYFNCAWYFQNAPALLPYHGVALQEFNPVPPNETQTYRFHLTDVIPFNSRFRFGMEHGRANNTKGLYDSVAYFYMQPMPGMEETVSFEVQDGGDVGYAAWGGVNAVSNTWFFEGDNDDIPVAATGVSFTGGSAFEVPVGENAGVLVRRLTDRGIGRQSASVYVDGIFAGQWYDADCNFVTARVYNTETYLDVEQRWNESEFLLPLELTAGKENIDIQIVRDEDAADSWNEYRYQVFRVLPLTSPADVDEDGLPDVWETMYYNNVGVIGPEADTDADGFTTLQEWIALTSPTSSISLFQMEKSEDDLWGIYLQSNRNYSLWCTTSLTEDVWENITNVTDSSGWFGVPAVSTNRFYRIEVDLGN